jgi:hypothetical protein
MFCPGTLGPHCGWPGPHTGGSESHPGVRFTHVEVLDQTWRPGLYIKGSGTFPWGSGLTGDASEYVTFSVYVAAPDPPMWWGQVCCLPRVVARGWGESWPGPTYNSFTTRLKIDAWVLRFYTAERGTLVSGYRQCLSLVKYSMMSRMPRSRTPNANTLTN